MVRIGFLIALLIIAAACCNAEPVKLLDKPAYPLYAVCSKPPRQIPSDDLRTLATQFAFAHGGFEPEQISELHRHNPAFKTLIYMNSTYTRPSDDVPAIEKHYRRAIAMTHTADLAGDIDAAQQRLRLVGLGGNERRGKPAQPIAIRASTVDGDVSARIGSTQKYVFWIRIGDELMRVEQFDPASGDITVTRGFDGSARTAHRAGAPVLAPLYLGFKRNDKDKHPGLYPGGPGDDLRYVLDANAPESWRFKAEQALAAMASTGADGVWLDTLNVGDFNVSDCLGRNAQVWNFAMGEPCAKDHFRAGQERKIDFMQHHIRGKTGRWPFLVANNMVHRHYRPGSGGLKLLIVPTPIKPRPLDAYCMEGALQPSGDLEDWRANVQTIMDAAQSDAPAAPIIGAAGSKSVAAEADTPGRDQRERFGYAMYLLGVEASRRTYMGTYAFYAEGQDRRVRVHRQYYYPIGDPAQTVKPAELEVYRLSDSPIYQRRFTNGLVLVNPTAEAAEVKLPAAMLDPDSEQRITTIAMPPHSGKILLNSGG